MAIGRFFQDIFGLGRLRGEDVESSGEIAHGSVVAAFDYSDKRIPQASRGTIAKVIALIDEIEVAAKAEEAWNPLLVEISQIREVYLPRLIKSYIDIPATHRAEIFRRTGHSASFMLNDGLDKLIDRLRTMSLSLAQGNIDAFTTAMGFIEMRYGPNPVGPEN